MTFATVFTQRFDRPKGGGPSYELVTKPLRMLTFGAAIGVISCYHGMHVRKLSTEVPKAAINAVMQSLIYVFAIDAVFVFFFYYVS